MNDLHIGIDCNAIDGCAKHKRVWHGMGFFTGMPSKYSEILSYQTVKIWQKPSLFTCFFLPTNF